MVPREAVSLTVAVTAMVGASVCALSFVYELATVPAWQVQELPGVDSWDGFYELAWDSEGDLQVAYIGIWGTHWALIYGEKTGKNWDITFLARLTYYHEDVSMTLDSDDNVYICTHYGDSSDESQIVFAEKSDGVWDTQLITVAGYRCTSAEVALDEDERVHILYTRSTEFFYEDSNSSIEDMVRTPDGWRNTTLAKSYGESHYWIDDLERRNDGSFGLIYTRIIDGSYIGDSPMPMSYLNYSIYSDGRLVGSTIMSSLENYGDDKSLCHDSDGNAYITTYKRCGNYTYSVCLYSNADGNWTCTDIAYGGGGSYSWLDDRNCLAIRPDGSLYVGYFVCFFDGDVSNHSARYCTNAGGEWRVHLIDTVDGFPTQSIALTVDDESYLHVIYSNSHHTIYTTDEPDPDKHTSAAYISGVRGVVAIVVVIVAAVALLMVIRHRRIVEEKRRTREAWIAETDAFADRGRHGES